MVRNEASLFAFRLPKDDCTSLRLIGSHTDSPCLKLKTCGTHQKENLSLLNFEVYGGALLNSWFDRDIQLAGRLAGERNPRA